MNKDTVFENINKLGKIKRGNKKKDKDEQKSD